MVTIVSRIIHITIDGIEYRIPGKYSLGRLVPDTEMATRKELRAWDKFISQLGHDAMLDSECSDLRI